MRWQITRVIIAFPSSIVIVISIGALGGTSVQAPTQHAASHVLRPRELPYIECQARPTIEQVSRPTDNSRSATQAAHG